MGCCKMQQPIDLSKKLVLAQGGFWIILFLPHRKALSLRTVLFADCQRTNFSTHTAGAILDRPSENKDFRIFYHAGRDGCFSLAA